MSLDRQIDQVCPHAVYEEALFVGSDRMTIRPLRPVASVASIEVLLNHEVRVPSYGVALPAKSTGTKEGPFTIQTGINDVFRARVNQGLEQVALFPASNRASVASIADFLNARIRGVWFTEEGGRLAFQSRSVGKPASVFIPATSTLAAAVGIQVNREYRGQQLVPGWTAIGDPATTSDRPTRLVVFDEPLRSGSDFVEINYTTVQQECRRCGGTGVEHDWRYDSQGGVVLTSDENLLIQELRKCFYTTIGTNPFHTWYGTSLVDTIGKKLTAGGFVQNLIVSDLYQAFSRWQSVKRQQEEKVGQEVTDKEFPFRLLSVDLQQSTKDPTVVFVNVTVQNRAGDSIPLNRALKIPQPYALLDSPAQAVANQNLIGG